MQRKRRNERGLTLVELIVAFSVMLILTTMAVPLARARVAAERRKELMSALREMRSAIDRYKDNCDQAYFGPPKQGTDCYPESLEQLVEGVKLAGFLPVRVIPRFLPYTTRSWLPQSPLLVRLYLRFPPIWRVLGKQAVVIARKAG